MTITWDEAAPLRAICCPGCVVLINQTCRVTLKWKVSPQGLRLGTHQTPQDIEFWEIDRLHLKMSGRLFPGPDAKVNQTADHWWTTPAHPLGWFNAQQMCYHVRGRTIKAQSHSSARQGRAVVCSAREGTLCPSTHQSMLAGTLMRSPRQPIYHGNIDSHWIITVQW